MSVAGVDSYLKSLYRTQETEHNSAVSYTKEGSQLGQTIQCICLDWKLGFSLCKTHANVSKAYDFGLGTSSWRSFGRSGRLTHAKVT